MAATSENQDCCIICAWLGRIILGDKAISTGLNEQNLRGARLRLNSNEMFTPPYSECKRPERLKIFAASTTYT